MGRRFALLCAATLLHFLAMGMLLAGLPLYLTKEMGSSRTIVGLAVGAFSLAAVVSRPEVGRRLDILGRRWFLAGGPLLLAASTAGLLLARSVPAVVALRLLHGLAGAAFYTSAATVATDLAPEDRRAHYLSRFSLFLYAGFAIGPALAEFLIRQSGFTLTWTVGTVSAFAAAGIALLLPETRALDREVERGRFRLVHPAAIGPGIVLLAAAVGYTSISVFAPLYAERVGMSSGPLYIAFAVTVIGVRLVGGGLSDRHGRVAVALPGLVVGAIGLAMLAFSRPVPALIGVSAYGAGFALLFPALMALAADRAPDSERGAVLGSFTAFFDVGSSVGGYLVGAIADARGFGASFLGAGALCLLACIPLLRTGRSTTRSSDTLFPAVAD